MSEKKYAFETLQQHAGHSPDQDTLSRAVPIYQTTSYAFRDTQHAADLFALKEPGNIYTRINNPTTEVLENRLAALEGAVGALATSSGMSAILYTILNLAGPGDEIISTTTLYGGTYTLFVQRLEKQFGIKTHLVDTDDLASVESKINDKTKCIYIETIGNPNINIPDIDALVELAHRHNLPLVADNTFGTPYLIDLKSHGVDITVHSLTKYIGGHGNSVGGAIVDYGTFDWAKSGRFPAFTEPDQSYHGIVYSKDCGDAGFITKARVNLLRDTGACISPFNSFLILLGLETLSLRVERHCLNAQVIAEYLAGHELVEWVNYPGLEEDKYYDRAQKYFPKGVGAIFSFGIKGGVEAGAKFIDALEIFSFVANVADSRSLIVHPASTTHSQLSEEDLIKAGVPAELVRISVGLEDVDDLIGDLEQALIKSQK